MIRTKSITTSNAFPAEISGHPAFRKNKTLKVVFPQIGLKNDVAKEYVSIEDGKKLDLVFSSDKAKGVWDIATMSMRGISSCMSWGDDCFNQLVGSIVDPFAGIIYLTDNTATGFGKRMTRRSVVRFVIVGEKPAVFIEQVYSGGKIGYDYDICQSTNIDYYNCKKINDLGTIKIFSKYIRSKVGKKYKVYDYSMPSINNFIYIPKHPIIKDVGYDISYSDYDLGYVENDYTEELISELKL